MTRQLLSVLDLDPATVERIIDRAIEGLERPPPPVMHGRHLGLWFTRPSTRTRTAFTLGAADLGASVISYQPAEMQLGTGETLADTAAVLAQYLDVLAMRCHHHGELQPFIDAGIPLVINALNQEEHPTQALADLMTLKQVFGKLAGLRLLFLGDGGNIATSLLYAGSRIPNLEMHFITPAPYGFPSDVIERAMALAAEHGSRVRYHHDPDRLPGEVDAVYTTRWRSMGEEKSDPDWREHFAGFQLNAALLGKVASGQTVVMHDLPAERGAEIDSATLDGPRSVVLRQAANKLHTVRALLELHATAELSGKRVI